MAILLILLLIFASEPACSFNSAAIFVLNTVDSHRIVIFSKTSCPYSVRAKQIFKQLQEKPFVVELDQREDGREIMNSLIYLVGRNTVPQVFINGRYVGGSDDTAKALRNGQLKKLLGKSNASFVLNHFLRIEVSGAEK